VFFSFVHKRNTSSTGSVCARVHARASGACAFYFKLRRFTWIVNNITCDVSALLKLIYKGKVIHLMKRGRQLTFACVVCGSFSLGCQNRQLRVQREMVESVMNWKGFEKKVNSFDPGSLSTKTLRIIRVKVKIWTQNLPQTNAVPGYTDLTWQLFCL
jgi:hypothetical protein